MRTVCVPAIQRKLKVIVRPPRSAGQTVASRVESVWCRFKPLTRNSSGSLAMYAAIRRASSAQVGIKAWMCGIHSSGLPGGGHEIFAYRRGCFRSYRLHRKTRRGAKRRMVRLLRYRGWRLEELRVRNL
jgi:hypothetical protein